ncbi:adhesin [Providencia rettgeri]|uniref:CS1 type fimbrial major subunit n=1 Tax=Providencia rettgeri TaxID=587 RepID=UPI001B36F06A|nr:CS1 type fimbrial major subunit [Providencia rettgeri]MBQ0399373.1 adhesin [Providencia rettgeri]
MLKKSLMVTLLSGAAFASMFANAADEQHYTIELSATIPSEAFQVTPVESGWINQTQEMPYDLGTNKLQPFSKQFQYKNTSGGIQATLTNTDSNGDPILSNGSDIIPLAVTFNGVKLSNEAATVVAADQAKAGGRTNLRITQKTDDALNVTGSFTGQVSLVFEPALVAPPSGS